MAATELGPGVALGEGGRYHLQCVLGSGGMASVWRAMDTRLERPVAVKVLSDVLALDRDYVVRFEREAQLAAGLSHPHLVSIYDFSAHGTRPYLVLELIAGGTLADRLRAPRTPDWDPVGVARELLGAIGYIHAAGIIHRDIKPANVLIGADGRARLTDFGIAQPTGATRITRTGNIIGTLRYIAPEVLAGAAADERSDLYAFGVLLGECLWPDASRQLPCLVGRLTDSDPRRRPPSAAAVLALLDDQRDRADRCWPDTVTLHRQGILVQPAAMRPYITRNVRQLRIHLTPTAIKAVVAVVVVLLTVVLLATAGGGTQAPAPKLSVSPAGAPFAQQLSDLGQAIDRSRR